MKDNLEDIEKLFRQSLEGHESDVSPDIWSGISSRISAPSPDASSLSSGSGASSGSIARLTLTKIVAVVGTSALLVYGGYALFSDSPKDETGVEKSSEIIESQEYIEPNADVTTSNEKPVVEEKLTKDIKPVVVLPAKNQAAQNPTAIEEPVSSGQDISGQDVVKTEISEEKTPETPIVNKSEKQSQTGLPEKKNPEGSREQEIEQLEIFEASIYASVKSGKMPLEVQFENNGSYSDNLLWKFRDGNESYSERVTHTFEQSGEYWVVLEIRNREGKISRDSIKIDVEGNSYIHAPNTFSPNGDGINDAFVVESENIESFKCVIFDRNQKVVFEWKNKNGHWDGKDMSENFSPAGTYFYVIEATDVNGKALKLKKGTVTLFR